MPYRSAVLYIFIVFCSTFFFRRIPTNIIFQLILQSTDLQVLSGFVLLPALKNVTKLTEN